MQTQIFASSPGSASRTVEKRREAEASLKDDQIVTQQSFSNVDDDRCHISREVRCRYRQLDFYCPERSGVNEASDGLEKPGCTKENDPDGAFTSAHA